MWPAPHSCRVSRPWSGAYANANGAAHYLSSTDADLLAAFAESETTVAFRARRKRIGTAETLLAVNDGTTTRVKLGWNSSNQFFVTRGATTFTVSAAGTIGANEVHTYGVRMSDTTCDVYVDGVLYSGTIGAASYTPTVAQLFCDDGSSEWFDGDLFSYAVFATDTMAADDLDQLLDWAAGAPWPADDYVLTNLRAVLTAGVDLSADVSTGVGAYFSDATDPSGPYFDGSVFFDATVRD
jgi:hypothetical protein